MLKYKLVQKGNPSNLASPRKYYASMVLSGRKNLNDISTDIEAKSALSRGDISNVLQNLVDEIPKHLLNGQSISLGELGTLRLSISGEGANTEEEFDEGMINKIKIVFTPGKKLKNEVAKAVFMKLDA